MSSAPGTESPAPSRPEGLSLAPFRGLRYVPERVSGLASVTSPPYDVVVRPDEQLHLETSDPHNVVRLILPQGEDPAARHEQAAARLRRWQSEGVLAADPEPALYVYEQRAEGMLQRGLIGALRLTPKEEGIVLPHEDVMPGPVADRAGLMRATAANLEPLLLAYRGGQAAAETVERTVLQEPLLCTTTEDGIRHRLWALTDPAVITAVREDLARLHALIADGHHRWATYLRLQEEHGGPGPWDRGLVLLVDTERYPLRVRAIHRVLYRLPPERALAALAASPGFRVREVDGPLPAALDSLGAAAATGNAFLLAGDGGFRLLTGNGSDPGSPAATALPGGAAHADKPPAWHRLDATVLHNVLLDRVWQVPDSPDHVGYLHDAAAAVAKAEEAGGTAVLLHPVSEQVVLELARQGTTMPRKSTSFGPKPATGLVIRSLELD
ncbi:DUF1015 family protein [Streptomyces sp. SCUT-3]|uniref:DUF1015 domain-containing protein n=1 Tax=Streptomyces TaxID=1883 RepID=UPI000CBC8B34|nr:DUF1015 domain-containing protein [Streptomyces sp. SCUT-3]PLW72656.1 DUF1015 domain-containing protein [Streptomyces sp. DJ]QMV24039.1 DUF1015 family protein [Streptomyces sp. SCUT-3]